MDKQELRAEIKARLRAADKGELARIDALVCRRVLARAEWQQAATVLSYAPFGRELDVTALNRAALAAGKRLCLPLITGEGQMEARLVTDLAQLVAGEYGILAPPLTAPLVEAAAIDLLIVPGLAFGPQGQRLGRGGGFYDRWLAQYSGPTLAPTRELQMATDIPCDPWDARVRVVVTEVQVIGKSE